MALFNLRDRLFYLTKKKESPGQVVFSELSDAEKRPSWVGKVAGVSWVGRIRWCTPWREAHRRR